MAEEPNSSEWYRVLTEGEPIGRRIYHLFGLLPSNPRCKMCAAPFGSWGGRLMRLMGREQSQYNPRFCAKCNVFEHPGGAEVELTMLFADVRGSTPLAERMSASEFSRLMSRFYAVASTVLIESDGLVDRLIGDEVVGLYLPGFAGPQHARKGIEAARRLLQLTGHLHARGPWVPVGIGVHTGPAFVGVVSGGPGTLQDFTALGDNVNIAARLAASAGAGEILVSDAAYRLSELDLGDTRSRPLELKGKSEPVTVHVLNASAEE